jgi:hypothetical protein
MNIIYPCSNSVSNNFAAGNELNDSITLSDLAEEKVWIAWKEQPNKQGKLTKIPKDPATGDNAKVPSDPTTYGTLGDAIKCCETMKGKGGVGVVLGAIGNGRHLVGIDLDSCREPKSETITDWAAEVIERFDTYSEISPSQTGIKLFFRLSTVDLQTLHVLLGRNHKGEQLARKTFAVGAHREVAIDTARFYAVTGARSRIARRAYGRSRYRMCRGSSKRLARITLPDTTRPMASNKPTAGICREVATLSASYGNVTSKVCPKPKRWRHC